MCRECNHAGILQGEWCFIAENSIQKYYTTQLTLPVNLVLNHHGTCSLYFVWGEFEYTPLCNMVDSLKLVLDSTIWKPHMWSLDVAGIMIKI